MRLKWKKKIIEYENICILYLWISRKLVSHIRIGSSNVIISSSKDWKNENNKKKKSMDSKKGTFFNPKVLIVFLSVHFINKGQINIQL